MTQAVTKQIPACEMIILFGSFARGDYVEYDQRVEYGVPTYYQSDFDILIVTSPDAHEDRVWERLSRISHRMNTVAGPIPREAPIRFIVEKINRLNEFLREGQYFYRDVKAEGIMLFDSENFTLKRRSRLKPTRYREIAKDYYESKMEQALNFLSDMKSNYCQRKYTHASFHLHQTTESLYNAVLLTFTLYKGRTHCLESLRERTSIHSNELLEAFPQETEEEKRLFKLLCDAYIQARYNRDFVVTKKDMDALIPCVERLKEIVEKICTAKIESIVDE